MCCTSLGGDVSSRETSELMWSVLHRKIFPPSPEELPTPPPETSVTDTKASQEEVEGSGVLVQETEATEPATKKAKTDSQETAKDDWEPVEKPGTTDAALEKSTEMSEGEKVEEEELAADDGEKIEKPKEEPIAKTTAGYEIVEDRQELDNKLGKDW